mmetsp:Transcript_46857/g.88006  ORF Transcript_46857/g.88006 Transcript_46857/m.88006 type:complete len:100 (-) Transcript_46857:287-586(-)
MFWRSWLSYQRAAQVQVLAEALLAEAKLHKVALRVQGSKPGEHAVLRVPGMAGQCTQDLRARAVLVRLGLAGLVALVQPLLGLAAVAGHDNQRHLQRRQ